MSPMERSDWLGAMVVYVQYFMSPSLFLLLVKLKIAPIFLQGLCVCVCPRVFSCMGPSVWVPVHTHGSQRRLSGVQLYLPPLYSLETWSLIEPEACHCGLPASSQDPPISGFSSGVTGICGQCYTFWLCNWNPWPWTLASLDSSSAQGL